MKTFAEFQEALIAGKDRLDPEVLKKYPDLDPTKARDYMKLKRLQKKLSPKTDLAVKTEEVMPTNNVGSNKIDLLQMIKDRFKEKGLMGFVKKREKPEKKTLADLLNLKTEEIVAPTNNVGDGKIAGTVEAGDDPPVKKRKKKPPMLRRKTYAKGGTKSRKPWLDYLKNK